MIGSMAKGVEPIFRQPFLVGDGLAASHAQGVLNEATRYLLDNTRLVIIPVHNIDGFQQAQRESLSMFKEMAESMTGIELGAGALALTLLSPAMPWLFPSQAGELMALPSARDAWLLLLLALACTLLPFALSLVALRHMSAFSAQLAINLEPVYAIVLAILLLGEQRELGVAFYLGVAVILASVFARAGGSLKIACPVRRVQEILFITNLGSIIESFTSEAAAIDSTYVRAHRSAHGGKGGQRRKGSALPVAARRPRSMRSPMSSAGPASSC